MTTKQNITLAVERGLLKKARALAAQEGHSVSSFIADHLREVVERREKSEADRRRALALLDQGFPMGGKRLTREELYDRHGLR